MKLFKRDQNKENIEKPIVIHYAKYVGVLSSNKSYPVEEGAYVHIYEDRVVIDLLKSKHQTVIPYKNMTDIQNVDAGNKVDLESDWIRCAFCGYRKHRRSFMEKTLIQEFTLALLTEPHGLHNN